MRLFHYTKGIRIHQIISDRQIKLATAGVPVGVKPAAWFTTNPTWEKLCSVLVISEDGREGEYLDEKETENIYKGLFRIEIDPRAAPYTWRDYKNLSGESREYIRYLEKSASRKGDRPQFDWRISFEPVSMHHWLCIEKWNGKQWEKWLSLKGEDHEGE